MGCGFASVKVGGTRLFQAQHFFCCCRRRRAFCHINATTKCDWSSSYGPCYVCHTWGDSFFSFALLCFALLTLCFLENRELFALSQREFLTEGGSWPFFHIAKIHGKWKSQDGWSLLDDYAWDIFFLLVLGFCSCFFRSCSQDEKKREFKMGVIALQNTELSFGFARIQWHGFGAWEVGLPYGFPALTMLELLLRYTCPLSCTPAGQQAKCRQCWVGGWVCQCLWVLVLILQVLHMRKRQCCEWNIRSKLILWQFFFLLVESKNLVGCGENVGFPRYQANRSRSWRICEQSLGMERKV